MYQSGLSFYENPEITLPGPIRSKNEYAVELGMESFHINGTIQRPLFSRFYRTRSQD